MKKRVNLLCGGIISLVMYLFMAILYITAMSNGLSVTYIFQFIFLTSTLLLGGIFGVIGKLENAYFVLSFLGWGNVFSFSTRTMVIEIMSYANYANINGIYFILVILGILSSIFYFILFVIGKCKINNKVNPILALSYVGYFLLGGLAAYEGLNSIIQEFRYMGSEYYSFDFVYALMNICLILAFITTIFAILKKQKALWASITFLGVAIISLGVIIYLVSRYAYYNNIYYLIIELLASVFAPFTLIVRPHLLNEETTKENNSTSNTYVYDVFKVQYNLGEETEDIEDDSTNNEDVEEKLKKLKSLYEKGLIREEEYKRSVDETLSNL